MYFHITCILLDSEFFLTCHLIAMLNLNISRFENSDADPEQHDNCQQREFWFGSGWVIEEGWDWIKHPILLKQSSWTIRMKSFPSLSFKLKVHVNLLYGKCSKFLFLFSNKYWFSKGDNPLTKAPGLSLPINTCTKERRQLHCIF